VLCADSEGIVEEAIMLGAPVTASADEWSPLARVVSGRIVNGYSRSSIFCLTYSCFHFFVHFSVADSMGHSVGHARPFDCLSIPYGLINS